MEEGGWLGGVEDVFVEGLEEGVVVWVGHEGFVRVQGLPFCGRGLAGIKHICF